MKSCEGQVLVQVYFRNQISLHLITHPLDDQWLTSHQDDKNNASAWQRNTKYKDNVGKEVSNNIINLWYRVQLCEPQWSYKSNVHYELTQYDDELGLVKIYAYSQ